MKCKFTKMTVSEFDKWIDNPESRKASLPEFFGKGVRRTRNVLAGNATDASVTKWKSFIARHGANYCRNPTARQRIAIKNWGYRVKKAPNEKQNA